MDVRFSFARLLILALLNFFAEACADPVTPTPGPSDGGEAGEHPADAAPDAAPDTPDAPQEPDAPKVTDATADSSLHDAGPADATLSDVAAPDVATGGDVVESGCAEPGVPDWATVADAGRTVRVAAGPVTLIVAVVAEGVVRLRYQRGAEADRASYAVIAPPDPAVTPKFGNEDGQLVMCAGGLTVRVDASARVQVRDDGGVLLEDGPAGGWFEEPGAVGVRRLAAPGERFYGFGEKTGPLDRRGRTLVFWNTDAYDPAMGGWPPDKDPLYQSIPFHVALRDGRASGVLTDEPHRLTMDVCASDPDAFVIRAHGGEIDQIVIAGPSIAGVLDRYTALTGRAPLPPRWALGYHQSRWGWWPDDRVRQVAQDLRSHAIPADGIWLDIQHMRDFRSWTWDPLGFPDPSQLVADLAALGFKTTVIVDPGVKVDPAWDIYAEGLAGGHFVEAAPGVPYVGEVWPGDSVFPDFTSKAARAFWASLVPRATNHGVRGIWVDMNEPASFIEEAGGTLPNDLPVDGDGDPTTMAAAHNVYGLLEAQAVREGMLKASPDRRPFVLSRAGYAGIQRYAAVWTGDAPSAFYALQDTLPMLLGLGVSGVPFVGSDVGGYSGGATPELFARWMQLGALSPLFRSHVTSGVKDQEPWSFGVEVTDISREFIGLRYSLLPYFYSLHKDAWRTGAPPLRPLVWEFQGDPVTHAISDQAMLGPFLLVAPVLEEGATTRTVYLPAGRWFEERSGAVVEGPTTLTVDVTLAALPMYVREGAIVPRAPVMQWSDQAPVDPLTLECYPSEAESSFVLHEDSGDGNSWENGDFTDTRLTLSRTGSGARLTVGTREGTYEPALRRVLARFRRVDHPVSEVRISGVAVPEKTSLDALLTGGHGWVRDEADLSVTVSMPDSPGTVVEVDADMTLAADAPPVAMPFAVKLPPGTPPDAVLHVATDFGAWAQAPVGAADPDGIVRFELEAPRGRWFRYKFTRGAWDSVEKWPACEEATDRYALGAAHPLKQDTVWSWADLCR